MPTKDVQNEIIRTEDRTIITMILGLTLVPGCFLGLYLLSVILQH